MAPRSNHRGGRGAGNRSGSDRHQRESRHAHTGAGVNRRGARGSRDVLLQRSGHGGGRARPSATPGARLVDRMTTGDSRQVDRTIAGDGEIRLADRITVGQGRLVDRMTGGSLQHVAREPNGHQGSPRARPPRGRVRPLQDRSSGRQQNGISRDNAATSRGLQRSFQTGNAPVAVTNGADHDEWELDTSLTTQTRPAGNSAFYASQASQLPSQSSARLPTLPTLPIPTSYTTPTIQPATSHTPIRMFNQPRSAISNSYQIVGPQPSLLPSSQSGLQSQPQPKPGANSPQHPVNKYRGKDKIKKLVQNVKLRAIFAGRPVPRERQVSKEQRPQLTMRMGGDGGVLDEY